jgi:hypothetical protein
MSAEKVIAVGATEAVVPPVPPEPLPPVPTTKFTWTVV